MRIRKQPIPSLLSSSTLHSTSLNPQLNNEAPSQQQQQRQLEQQEENDELGKTCVPEATDKGRLAPDKGLGSLVQSDSANQPLQRSSAVQDQPNSELILVLIRGENGFWTCPDAEIQEEVEKDEEECLPFFFNLTHMEEEEVQELQVEEVEETEEREEMES